MRTSESVVCSEKVTRHERDGSGPVSDALFITWRNLKRIPRIPELAIFAILQSIMFVLLFAFVFGGAIRLPDGGDYKESLMPGIFVQTIAFASATTAIGMADDMGKGLIGRFRFLPMARSAVLTGRRLADVIYQAGILVVLMLAGLAVGWRVNNGLEKFLLAVVLLLSIAYVMAWIGVWTGLVVPNTETAQ
ncbi:MAG: ABC transporter permease [Actinobacteria bacterium]|nr:ABC transporter permease [Actinomycetota bacterium]